MTDETQASESADDCLIPPPAEPEALERYLLKTSPFDGASHVRRYVETQSPNEKVTYLERISSERVVGIDHDIWDVHTISERYWVITNPTNLYAQRLFPSADYTLTFHVGLAARIASRRDARADEEQQERATSAWRRLAQAGEALDTAHEAEEFQAVGMRCRECLLELVRAVASEAMVPPGQESPKMGDFIHWSEVVANAVAAGSRAKELRSYLKTVAKSTWQLVSWLTHASSATRFDAETAVEATQGVLVAFTSAVLRAEQGAPNRCPNCSSYRISSQFMPEYGTDGGYVTVCGACGWADALGPNGTEREPGA